MCRPTARRACKRAGASATWDESGCTHDAPLSQFQKISDVDPESRSCPARLAHRGPSALLNFFWNCNCDYRLPGQAPPTALYKATNAVTADVRPTASSLSALNSVRWASRTCKKSVSPASYLSCARSSACVLARTASLKLDKRARERS